MLSIGKILLNTYGKATHLIENLKSENFFLETDDHKLSIDELYGKVASIKKISIGILKSEQQQNFKRVFGFNPTQ